MKVYLKIIIKKTIIELDDIENEKQKFHWHKRPISIKNIYINKIVVSNKVSTKVFKYFIGYKDPTKLDLYAYFIIYKRLSRN